jgi:hypothetical protein
MEEADLRLAETKKESYEFERDIVKGAMNPRTGKVIAEKVIRYLDEKNRSRVSVVYLYGQTSLSKKLHRTEKKV